MTLVHLLAGCLIAFSTLSHGAATPSSASESMAAVGDKAPPPVRVPVAFTTFPGEIWAAPRSWVEAVYPGLAHFNQVDRGGHFAAWEEPALFASELRAAFRSLR